MEEDEQKQERSSKKKSLSRDSSSQRRSQGQLKLKSPKQKDKYLKSSKTIKYRRKAANAKERERMKNLNFAFERLKNVMPDIKSFTHEQKVTKVTTLRAAIAYIVSLQKLMEDLNAGRIDPEQSKKDEKNLTLQEKKCVKSKQNNKPQKNAQTNLKKVAKTRFLPIQKRPRLKLPYNEGVSLPNLQLQVSSHQICPHLLHLNPVPPAILYCCQKQNDKVDRSLSENYVKKNVIFSDMKGDSIDGDNPGSPETNCEAIIRDGDSRSLEIPFPSKIDQLFKRSFSHELEDLARECGGEQYLLLEQLVHGTINDKYMALGAK